MVKNMFFGNLTMVVSVMLLALMYVFVGIVMADTGTAKWTEPLTVSATQKHHLKLSKGQILTLAMPVVRAGADNIVKEYAAKAFPLAREFGLQSLITLPVVKTYVGEINPSVVSLFSWPGKQAEANFANHPQWPVIKELRAKGWQHLNIFNTRLTQDIEVNFHSNRFYTIVVAWFNEDSPGDYQAYLNNIENALNEVGGKFLLRLHQPEFETLSNPHGQPGQITFVEWPDADGFKRLQQHPEYQEHRHLFGSGLRYFEFYGLKLLP